MNNYQNLGKNVSKNVESRKEEGSRIKDSNAALVGYSGTGKSQIILSLANNGFVSKRDLIKYGLLSENEDRSIKTKFLDVFFDKDREILAGTEKLLRYNCSYLDLNIQISDTRGGVFEKEYIYNDSHLRDPDGLNSFKGIEGADVIIVTLDSRIDFEELKEYAILMDELIYSIKEGKSYTVIFMLTKIDEKFGDYSTKDMKLYGAQNAKDLSSCFVPKAPTSYFIGTSAWGRERTKENQPIATAKGANVDLLIKIIMNGVSKALLKEFKNDCAEPEPQKNKTQREIAEELLSFEKLKLSNFFKTLTVEEQLVQKYKKIEKETSDILETELKLGNIYKKEGV